MNPKVEIIPADPVPQPPDTVKITMSREDAERLAELLGQMCGSSSFPFRLYAPLERAGIRVSKPRLALAWVYGSPYLTDR